MSAKAAENSSDSDNLCIVCFKNVEIYSIGSCDHPVCFECSTRMRFLCKQNECPICRRDLPKVLFTKTLEPFSSIFSRFDRSNLQDRKYGIIFSTSEIQRAYYRLLEHRCKICEETEHSWPFKTFQQLKDHMRKEHELFYCDICSENLKIFSFERMCYTRQELGYHRRKGDKNNTSHRGHPLCEFCDTRFMDNDELFRHLRRNHLFCHFCDADGKHHYYNSMDDLKRHFKEEHFLCEEGECRSMPLTAVFRTDIDLKGHIAIEHSKSMSKSATRQARTLELEFTMAPRPRNDNIRGRKVTSDYRERPDSDYTMESGETLLDGAQRQVFVNPLTSDQFPALGGASSSNNTNITVGSKNYTKFSSAAFNSNDFPSLGGAPSRATPAVTITANSGGSSAPEVTITRTVRGQNSSQKLKESFPALAGLNKPPGSSTVRLSVNSGHQQQTPKVSIQVNQKSNGAITTHITTTSAPSTSTSRNDFFPALGNPPQAPTVQPQWVQVKPKKQVAAQKQANVAPCPVLEPTDLNSFPSLTRGKNNEKPKKSSSVMVPVDSWVNLNSIKGGSEKSSKKSSNYDRGESGNEQSKAVTAKENGGGRDSGNAKRAESSNKKASKPNISSSSASLNSKLENLRLVETRKPDEKVTVEDAKRQKKKKNKNSNETNNINNSDGKSENKTSKNISESSEKETGLEKLDINENKNGMTKKRSELKIGTLTNNGNEDFPALGSTKPPPGFNTVPQSSTQTTVKPPPGFTSSNFPSLNFANDLTFTSSSGQSYAISPTTSPSTYKRPQNFQERNQNLIKKFMDILNDNESIRQFKGLSDEFRRGDVNGKRYHERCKTLLGNHYDEFFPELLVLLPDIDKQQELFKEMDGKGKAALTVCEKCRQVIYKMELKDHYNHHRLENHFPSLGSAQQISSVWKK